MKWFWTAVGVIALVSACIDLWTSEIDIVTKAFLSISATTGVAAWLLDHHDRLRTR